MRYHVFFVIRLATREVQIAGTVPEPHGVWMKQVATPTAFQIFPRRMKWTANKNGAGNGGNAFGFIVASGSAVPDLGVSRKKRMSRRKVIIIGSVIALGVGLGFALPRVGFYLLTGRVFPIYRIDALTSAVEVRGWDAEGLRFADGRRIQLPEFRRLPVASAALAEATKRGVEISPERRVYGLVRVHHWCGNDPVREHIARVDISEMLTFLRDGERVSPPSDPVMLAYEPGGRFSEWGWRVGEFLSFDRYSKNCASNKKRNVENAGG